MMAEDWPQWRGPNRNGQVSGFTAPQTWGLAGDAGVIAGGQAVAADFPDVATESLLVDAAVVGFQPAKPRVIHTTVGAALMLEGLSATVTVFLRAESDVLPAVWTDRRGHHPRRETMQEHDG